MLPFVKLLKYLAKFWRRAPLMLVGPLTSCGVITLWELTNQVILTTNIITITIIYTTSTITIIVILFTFNITTIFATTDVS